MLMEVSSFSKSKCAQAAGIRSQIYKLNPCSARGFQLTTFPPAALIHICATGGTLAMSVNPNQAGRLATVEAAGM